MESDLFFRIIFPQSLYSASARTGDILNIMDLSFIIFSTCNQEAVTQFTGPGGAIPGGSRRLPGIKDMDTLVELWRNIHCL